MGDMTAETLRRMLEESSMNLRFLLHCDDVLPMGLNDLADLLEIEGTWDAFSERHGIARDHRLFVEDKDADLDREVWFVWFRDGNTFFIAYGPDPMRMRVYRPGDGVYHPRTWSMWFPSCTKFMPYATGGEVGRSLGRRFAVATAVLSAHTSGTPDSWLTRSFAGTTSGRPEGFPLVSAAAEAQRVLGVG